MNEKFSRFAHWTSNASGTVWAFLLALAVVVIWFIFGLIHGFSDTVQLVINTGTTIVTFLMVFLIQNTQNRDSRAIHVKLDDLIRAVESAENRLIGLEDQPEEDIERAEEQERLFRSRDTGEEQ